MRWKLSDLVDEYKENTGQSLSYRKLSGDLGMGINTIAKMFRSESTRLDVGTMESVLIYFSEKLNRQLNTGDLLELER